MLFPELRNERFGYINLNMEAKRWRLAHGRLTDPNPLLNPIECKEFVRETHARLGIKYSYGGWMEYRADVWHGSYLDARNTHIHLGIDFNVPDGTAVAADESIEVLHVDDDMPEVHGWGGRVIAKRVVAGDILIYAHLGDVYCLQGDVIPPRRQFARVGSAPRNGGWYPHLHVQCVEYHYYWHHYGQSVADLSTLDGYDVRDDLAKYFPDPMNVIKLHD